MDHAFTPETPAPVRRRGSASMKGASSYALHRPDRPGGRALYALVAMALFLSYRILDIADLTTDGSFVLGCAVSAMAAGAPSLAIPAAMLPGAAPGFITAFLQTKLGVPSILAGIVTNIGLYTVNLMAGWKAKQSFSSRRPSSPVPPPASGRQTPILLLAVGPVLAWAPCWWFLGTRLGLHPATGDNKDMVRPPPSIPTSPSPWASASPTP